MVWSKCAGVLIKWNVCALISKPNMSLYDTLAEENHLTRDGKHKHMSIQTNTYS